MSNVAATAAETATINEQSTWGKAFH